MAALAAVTSESQPMRVSWVYRHPTSFGRLGLCFCPVRYLHIAFSSTKYQLSGMVEWLSAVLFLVRTSSAPWHL